MSTANSTGVYQRPDGFWEYRFTLSINGKKLPRRKSTDLMGNKLKTKREAIKAREEAIIALRTEKTIRPKPARRTIKEVFDEFCATGRRDRAYRTMQKQDSLWVNHLSKHFGKRYVDEISVAEVNDYLAELYYENEYAYSYVESFLKMFYLFFGQAYSRGYLDVDSYNMLCVNKNTKIHMPKQKSDEDDEIVSFSKSELVILDDYFRNTNAETAYLLGRYCGLRINECFGLKWSNVDLEHGTIYIDRQQQYQNGLIKLVPPKTRNSKRTLQLSDTILNHLRQKAEQHKIDEVRFASIRHQNQRMIEDLDGKFIPSTELVNCLPNGKIQTVNSFKYPSREIKSKLGIFFKYHYLRHTYGTMMAELNTPTHLLCKQMGHGNIRTTQRYYLAVTEDSVQLLRNNLNQL